MKMNANSLDRFIARASCAGLLIMLASCASVFTAPAGFGLQWHRSRAPLPMVWYQVKDLAPYCTDHAKDPRETVREYGDACGHWPESYAGQPGQFTVFSIWSEEKAKRVRGHDGEYIWLHEKRHSDGEDHQRGKLWGMTLSHGCVVNCGQVF